MKYLSLFSGIEAATVAWRTIGWECVAVSEVDKFPSAVLAHHYPGVPNLGDVTKITEEDIARLGPIDVIAFGSPCQDMSVAGKRAGLSGERSGLFHTAIRIIQWARRHNGLRFALWENVPGAFSSNQGRDFACVVGEMAGLRDVEVPRHGWGNEGVALGDAGLLEWATLDAQWFGLAQRRRRVFALADFGNWSDRPPILVEPESVRGDSPPRREAGETATRAVAPSLTASGRGVARVGDTRGEDPVVAVAFGGNKTSGPIEVATARNAHGGTGRMDFESETFVVHGTQDPCVDDAVAFALGRNSGQENAVCVTGDTTHALCAEGADASEDGTGRGTPIIAFSCKDYGGDAVDGIAPTLRAMGHSGTHANAGGQVAVAVSLRGRDGGGTAEIGGDVSNCLRASGGGGDKPHALVGSAHTALAVRRLTPRECERLMGVGDDYTCIPWRKRPAEQCPDGPRYRALGNSFAVPVVRWIGRRIQMAVEASLGAEDHAPLADVSRPKRPIIRYHGGKWKMAPWIIKQFPPHRVYVEPFGGAASVLLRKAPSRVEVLNDLNGRLVNAFRVLRDPDQAARLQSLLRLTPCSEQEYRLAREVSDDPVEDARRLIVLGHQAFGSTGATGGKLSGWRRGVRPTGPASSQEWASLHSHVLSWADRLRSVYIENTDALSVIARWDSPDTLFYVDPPYVIDARTTGRGAYGHEMTDDEHAALADLLRSVEGRVIISGYPSTLYEDLYAGWARIERPALADQARRRTEVLWIKPQAPALMCTGRVVRPGDNLVFDF